MRRAAEAKRDILGEEFQLKLPGGEMVDILSFASPVFDEKGRVRGLLNAYVDITERKSQERMRSELEQRLQRAARMQSLGVMAAGIAHDFNNLLTGIIGEASLAADTISPSAEAQRHIASSLEAAQRAADLVRKVVAYTGQLYYDLRPTDLGEVVRGSEATLLSLAGSKAKIQFRMADPLPQVLADPEEIRHALCNLVLNAVEAAEPGRNCIEIGVDVVELRGDEVELTARKVCLAAGPYLRVQVADNGPGMPPEIAAGAFDPFFTTKFLGRGLGLPEVLGIALSHHGGVKMETAPGGGTSVKLFIPAYAPEA
jgi:signal transduction histidine kinase